jgi:hypothetical protein
MSKRGQGEGNEQEEKVVELTEQRRGVKGVEVVRCSGALRRR